MNSIANKESFRQFFFEKKASVLPNANYLKLQAQYDTTKKTIHAFFENLDDFEFYRTSISGTYFGYKVKEYLLEGKQNVKDSFLEVDWNKFNKALVLFFVDKDYDDLTGMKLIESDNFFYTKWYSIENYLVCQDVFDIVLTQFFTNMRADVKSKLITLFNIAHKEFQSKIRVLTRFILIFRSLKKEIDLDKIKMDDFIVIHSMKFMEKKLISEFNYNKILRDPKSTSLERRLARKDSVKEILINKCLADGNLINFESLLKKEHILNKITEPKVYVRGKYELWFFIQIIKTVTTAAEDVYKELGIDNSLYPIPNKKFDVVEANAFHLLASKMSTSPDVESFLNFNFNKINESN